MLTVKTDLLPAIPILLTGIPGLLTIKADLLKAIPGLLAFKTDLLTAISGLLAFKTDMLTAIPGLLALKTGLLAAKALSPIANMTVQAAPLYIARNITQQLVGNFPLAINIGRKPQASPSRI